MEWDWVSPLASKIIGYYRKRILRWPGPGEALLWAQSEMGEAADKLLSMDTRWVRNNPQDHPVASNEEFGEELGDAIMMLVVAGLTKGVDPLQLLEAKIERKLMAGSQTRPNQEINNASRS